MGGLCLNDNPGETLQSFLKNKVNIKAKEVIMITYLYSSFNYFFSNEVPECPLSLDPVTVGGN